MPGVNRFRKDAKFEEATFAVLVYLFCNGAPIKFASRHAKLSLKTVRSLYLELRHHLLEPEFNQWHGTNRRLIDLSEPGHEAILRAGFFYTLSLCASNQTCARNRRLGNRKQRQCRKCPLAEVYADERREQAYFVLDAVHDFYEKLGIRGEKGGNAIMLLRERLIHTTVVATALKNTRKLPNGLFDPKDRGFGSGILLVEKLLARSFVRS